MKRPRTILGTALLTTAVAAFAAPAYAGEGGNGGEKSNAQPAAQSTNAPANANGAEHANSHAAAQPAPSSSSSNNSAGAPTLVKKADHAAQSENASSSAANVAADKPTNPASTKAKKALGSAGVGVKPSNSTAHNTTATASSNSTKLYGNGQTAGQIAIQHGAAADAVLYGPGNSQPHKTAPCGTVVHGNGGGFDVHALKSHSKKHVCPDEPSATSSPKDPAVAIPSRSHVSAPAVAPPTRATPESYRPSGAKGTASGVKGAAVSSDRRALSEIGAVGDASLPFTGLPLWSVTLVALALVGAGLSLRRQAVAEA